MSSGNEAYFGVSATRASMFARLLPADDPAFGTPFSENDWHSFIEKYTPLLFGVCRQFKLQVSDAEDVAQETILKIMTLLREGKFAYDSRHRFRSYLATVIRNAVLDSLRKRKRIRNDSDDALEAAEEEQMADQVQKQVNRELLFGQAIELVRSEMRPDHWMMFEQTYLLERNAADVSAELGASVSNIHVVCLRARKKITETCQSLAIESRAIGIDVEWD